MEALQIMKYSGSRKIFETLLKFSNRQFTINELAKEARVPFASTWRIVKRWEPAGLIETGRIGRSVTVKLHKSNYVDSIATLLKISKSPQSFTASALEALLAKEKMVKAAYLFGSVAKGEEKLASDIDIALLAERGFDANRLIFDIYERYGTKIVPLVFGTRHEIESFMAGKKGERLK